MAETFPTPAALSSGDITLQDSKGRILAVATRLFGAHGYDATSIQAIAHDAGIRKQSLLYHYPSKEALRHAVIEAWLLHWKEALPGLLAQPSGHDRFSSSVAALLNFFREDPNRARLALRELLDRPAELQSQMHNHLQPWLKLFADYIRMGQATGLIRPSVQPESYVVQVLLMVVTTVAIGDEAAALARSDSAANVDELIRIARDALFINPLADKQEP